MGKKYTLSFAGDTSLGDWYIRRSNRRKLIERLENDPLSFVSGVKPLVEKSDYFILNLETVLEDNPERVLKEKEYPNYDSPKSTLEVLKDLSVTAVSLANNHTMDFGDKVFLRTIDHLKDAKIGVFGAGKNKKEASAPFKITLRGDKGKKNVYILTGMRAGPSYREYGFFAGVKSPGMNSLPKKRLSKQITSLRKKDPDSIIIIYPHWQGQDYKKASVNLRVQERYRAFIDAGANHIVGHGTHLADDIEYYNGGTIAYSLGNFIFNSPGRYKKLEVPPYSLVLNMEFHEQEDGSWSIVNKYFPIVSDNRMTNYKTVPVIKNKKIYFQLTTLSSRGNMTYNILDKLGIPQTLSKPNKKIPRFSEARALANEFEKRNIKTERLERYLVAYINGEAIYFRQSSPSTESRIGSSFASSKSMTKHLLEKNDIAVARGKEFNTEEKNEALEYSKNFNSVVVKPLSGSMGRGVTTGVTSEREFLLAWDKAGKVSKGKVLIEEQFIDGEEFRYLVIGGKYSAAHIRISPRIVGNGVDTIADLVQVKNNRKSFNPYLAYKLIEIDEQRKTYLDKRGYSLDHVLEKDEELIIDSKGGLSTGGDSVDMTDKVHPSFKKIAEDATKALPGLDVVGVDILAKNHLEPASDENYIVLEVNTRPGMGGHIHPSHGESRNVAKDIVDFVISEVQNNQSE